MRMESTAIRPVLAAVLAAGAAGCSNLASFSMGELPVPAGSPVAVAALQAVRNPGPYPTFAGIPELAEGETAPTPIAAAPLDDRDQRIQQAKAALAAIPPGVPGEAEAFAAQLQSTFNGLTPVTDAELADMEAFIRQARARATPPPPPS